MGHGYPAPAVIDTIEDTGSGTSITVDLPLTGAEIHDGFVAHVLWFFSPNIGSAPDTDADVDWVKRRGVGVIAEDQSHAETWVKSDYAGTETDVTFTSATAATAILVAIHLIDNHHQDDLVGPQYDSGLFPQIASDVRYHAGMTIEPHEAVRFLVFDIIAGHNKDGGAFAAPGAVPPGYTYEASIISGLAHLHVASKRNLTPEISENPAYPTVGVGGWTFQTPGNAWTWTDVGTPENNDGGTPSPPEFAFQFAPCPYIEAFHYHEYAVDVEEDVPFWGMLCTPSEGS